METEDVLVVDDEEAIRRTVAMALEEAGFRAAVAEDGPEALDRLDHGAYGLMLLDLRLPGMDGMEVLRQARTRHPEVPVVMITAHGDVASAVAALQAGAVHFIQKPFPPERIQEVAVQTIGAHRPVLDRWYDDYVRKAADLIRTGRLEEARVYAQYTIVLDESRPEGHNVMGVIHQMKRALSEARACYGAALAVEPEYAPAGRNLANLDAPSASRDLDAFDLGV